MAQGLPVYTRLREDSDEEEVVPSVASEEVKPPEPPPASQTPVAAETEEKAPEGAPPVQPGFQPVVAIPPGYQPAPTSGYEPAAVPVGVTPGYQPAGMPPAGPTPVAATALNATTSKTRCCCLDLDGYPPPPVINPSDVIAKSMYEVVQMQPTGGMAVLYPQSKPENFLVLSVFSMLCCCFVFGLIALIYSLRVNSSWNIGDYEDARSASKTAKHWNIAAIVTGGIFAALGGVILLMNIIGFTVVNATRRY